MDANKIAQDLENARPLIERYYKVHKLQKVMEIMDIYHNTRATENMYKKRIAIWHLAKKRNIETQMKDVVRKVKARTLRGEASSIRVRNRSIKWTDVVRYWKRKGKSVDEVLASCNSRDVTPDGVEIVTPVESPLSTPAVLAVPERILTMISNYFQGSFDSGTWFSTDPTKLCSSIKNAGNLDGGLADFTNYIDVGYKLFNSKKFKEGGQYLICATALVKDIIFTEDPETLSLIFDMIQTARYERRPEVAAAFLRQFAELGKVYAGPNHPISQITTLLCALDIDIQIDFILEAFHSVADLLEERLGPSHATVICARQDQWFYPFNKEEYAIEGFQRYILACEEQLGVQDERCLNLHVYLGDLYLRSWRYAEAEGEANHVLQAYEWKDPDSNVTEVYTEGLRLLSDAYFGQQNFDDGEAVGRDFIESRMLRYGKFDAQSQSHMVFMGDQLAKAGRHESAMQIERWRIEILAEQMETTML